MGLNGAQNYSVRIETVASALEQATADLHTDGDASEAWLCPATSDYNAAGGDRSPILAAQPRELGDEPVPHQSMGLVVVIHRTGPSGKCVAACAQLSKTVETSIFGGWMDAARKLIS
jgi:hypothetical protein